MPSEAPAPQRFSSIHMPDTLSDTTGCEQEIPPRNAHGGWQSQYIDSQPIRNHITRLRRAGMGIKQIAKLCGIAPGAVQIIVDRRTGSAVKVLPSTAAKILSVAVPPTPSVMPAGTQCVSAIGTTRRLRALIAAGYTPSMLSRELGIALTNAYALFGHCDDVPPVIAQAVADLFDRLEMIPGPSDRARELAHKLAWAPPLAWDQDRIDDADTHPAPAATKHASFPERYRELRELGVHDESAIARRLGMKVDSLQRQLARYRKEVAIWPGAPVHRQLAGCHWAPSRGDEADIKTPPIREFRASTGVSLRCHRNISCQTFAQHQPQEVTPTTLGEG